MFKDLALSDLGTQKIRQILLTTHRLRRVSDKEERVSDMLQGIFVSHNCILNYINVGAYIQLSVSKANLGTEGSLVLQLP